MKPLGLTSTFQVVHPTRAQDKVWEAVQEAIASGMTVAQFIAEARESWAHELREAAKWADDEFQRAQRGDTR